MKKENLVICPVYNEERTLQEFYLRLRRYYTGGLLFVDDGSTDKSKDFLLTLKDEKTFLIRHPHREGYGQALISGFRFFIKNHYEKAVVIDADLQHNPRHIPDFFRGLSEADVVLGSRYIRIDSCLEVPRQRSLINRYISRLISLLFSVKFTDSFCGYRGYRDTFLKKVHLEEKSYGLGLEIILELIRTKTFFKDIPVEIIYYDPSRKFLDGLDDPKKRLLYYLEVISRKKKEIEDEEKIFSSKSPSRRCRVGPWRDYSYIEAKRP